MPINQDKLYPKYLIWLEEKEMANGGKEVSKISKSLFEEFKFRYLTNPKLNTFGLDFNRCNSCFGWLTSSLL